MVVELQQEQQAQNLPEALTAGQVGEAWLVASLEIVQAEDPFSENDFLSRADVAPELMRKEEGVWRLVLHNQGEYGKFERAYVRNRVVFADASLVAVHCAFHGTRSVYGRRKGERRAAKGQFWRFYRREADAWRQVSWRELDEPARILAQTAYQECEPAWVKSPGLLLCEHKPRFVPRPPAPVKLIAYKIVRVVEGRYYSVYQPDEEYLLGQRKCQPARPGHAGGYFSYPEVRRMVSLFLRQKLFPSHLTQEPFEAAVLEVEISGRVIRYNRKLASTYLRPVREIKRFVFRPQ